MNNIATYENVTAASFIDFIKPKEEPAILKNFVANWPAVKLGEGEPHRLLNHLEALSSGLAIPYFACEARHNGRFFYRDDLASFNYRQEQAPISGFFEQLRAAATSNEPTAYFAGSLALDAYFPNFSHDHHLNGLPPASQFMQSMWIGNHTLTAPHYDNLENIACVVAGRRKFTLFPIDQFHNLYVGPLDLTPAGQAISLIDIRAPDYDRFPRYREAEALAMTATLEPGDAIYIPTLWWHGVESLDTINIMVNTWWRDVPSYFGSPTTTLLHALLSLRDLPKPQRDRWKVIFDTLIFDTYGPALDHLPVTVRGIAGTLNRSTAARLRDLLSKSAP